MTHVPTPVRRWGDDFQLRDLIDAQAGGRELVSRDFALLTIVINLAAAFPRQLVFKGGFVLRHVHGVMRFSKDVDATRAQPPQHKLDADLQVEVSYREAVVDAPAAEPIGEPFYEPIEILAMAPHEMAAEKLRTLAQRVRATDLADLAVILQQVDVADDEVRRVAIGTFELVAAGRAKRIDRIERNIAALGAEYDDVVPAVFPAAPDYRAACAIVAAHPTARSLVTGLERSLQDP